MQAVDLDPLSANALFRLAWAHFRLGERDDGVKRL